jgi:multiple sugar transport system substrate-binding protein
MTHPRRGPARAGLRAALSIAAASLLVLSAGCTPATKEKKVADPGVEASGDVEFWHFFTDREAKAIQTVIDDFSAKYPKIKVTVKAEQDDAKMTQAIGAGQGPDIGLSYSASIVGKFCSSGAWIDLKQYLQRDKVDLNQFPANVKSYTEYRGKRCAMPFLTDAYGLYYNKKMFTEAGVTAPPKTLEELSDLAKKLTKRKADGTIEVAGFLPLMAFYENTSANWGVMAGGAKWLNKDETSAIAGDPAWQKILKFQKELVDWYGYDNLEKFRAGLGDEFSADNAFQKGQIAMNFDGEYRIAFIKDQSPDIQFGTAPFPNADPSKYGAGQVIGNIIGISRTAKNPEAAWVLLKYLTTNTDAIVKLSNSIKNIPTTNAALGSKDLQLDPEFKTFIDIFKNPNSTTPPPSAVGPAYQEAFQNWWTTWQSGKVTDLNAGLKDVDKQINDVIKLGG